LPSESGESCIDRVDLQRKGLEFLYTPAVVDWMLEQVLLESLPTMRVKKQNLHEEKSRYLWGPRRKIIVISNWAGK